MSTIDARRHDWEDKSAPDSRVTRICRRCHVSDRRTGVRGWVQWPCIVAQETWTIEQTRDALVVSGMKLRYVDLLRVMVKDGKHYAGLQIPDAGKYGLSLYPAKSQGTLYPGKALALFFNWAMNHGFDLDTDPVLQERLSSKTGS